MHTIDSLLIRTDITCVKLINNLLLSGNGGQLHIFDKSLKLTKNIVKVFDGQKIYGIELNSTFTQCLIYGANQIKIFSCDLKSDIHFKEIIAVACKDWILTAKWINSDNNIATVFMHNIVILWTKEMKMIRKMICEERCIVYSAYLANDTWDDLIVLSGTVFSQVLIWWPKKSSAEELCPVLCRLEGHKGVIFSIHYNPTVGLICSTSDDRSARLWSIPHKSLLMELVQPNIQVSLKFSLYGHSARVFRCQILDNYVLTAGEDSLINLWNLEGKLIRKIEAHQGACVWALDCDESNNVIATGGGDSGVTLFPLNQNFIIKEIKLNNNEVPKRVGVLKNNDLISISENGVLECYSIAKNQWTDICKHDDLISYALLEVSLCRHFIALAGYRGSIHIYKQCNADLKHLCAHEITDKSRIFSLHWLSSEKFLTCGPEGKISVWNLNENSISHIKTLQLPPSKERWTTAACALNEKDISVGDRKGNVYLYSLECTDPIQILRKAHNYLGITNLYFKNNELSSLGRNSIVRKYQFEQSVRQLLPLSSDKVPFTWLAALCKDDNTMLLAFLGDEFVIWDHKTRRTLLQFNCGGGHRSWDFHKSDDKIHFVFIKDKNINLVQLDWNSLHPADIIDGYHVNEINSACCLYSKKTRSALYISGGEDTTLRISTLHFKDNFVNLKTINVLKSHLSSIRVITSCKIHETTENGNFIEKHLLFSAGGRAQIVLWELQVNFKNDANMNVMCSEQYSYYEQLASEDSETRIMDLCTVTINSCILLIAACSDGTLKVFLIVESKNKNSYQMFSVGSVNYKLKCILKVSHLQICKSNLIASMSTDGNIAFWDFTNFINYLSSVNKHSSEIKDDIVLKNLIDLKKFYCIKIHQSGINSFAYRILDSNKCIFLSGGDDNAVCVNLLKFNIQSDKIDVQILSKFCDISCHCAQVTGIFITDNYFLTTSVDQKLNVFKWTVKNSQLNCSYIQKYNSSVADIQGMQCFENNDTIYAILHGKGIELCKIQVNIT